MFKDLSFNFNTLVTIPYFPRKIVEKERYRGTILTE